ncbi:MAG: hypothetical protein V3W20_12155 [Candidatus Neomarinimicrobiota bacterium]
MTHIKNIKFCMVMIASIGAISMIGLEAYAADTQFTGTLEAGNPESNTATGDHSSAFGDGTIASGDRATAFGMYSIASGEESFAVGSNAIASGGESFSFGQNTTASGENSFALGSFSEATASKSFAMGNFARAHGISSTAFGNQVEANGIHSAAFGNQVEANALSSFAIGTNGLQSIGNTNEWVATDPIFTIGNGESTNERSNAVTVLKNGNVGIGTSTPNSLLTLDEGYLQLDTSAGTPPSADCNESDEVGRMKVDSTSNSSNLYVCTPSGWATK